jgi:hypothetical protein
VARNLTCWWPGISPVVGRDLARDVARPCHGILNAARSMCLYPDGDPRKKEGSEEVSALQRERQMFELSRTGQATLDEQVDGVDGGAWR